MGDEFKPEDDFRPDTSDRRRPVRRRSSQTFTMPKVAISRQYVMIGTGILVLLILIISIGSTLKEPSSQETAGAQTEKSVSLPSSTSLASGSSTSNDSSANSHVSQADAFSGRTLEQVPRASAQVSQPLSAPLVASTQTQSPVSPPLADQQQVDSLPEGSTGNAASTLPTAPATLLSSLKEGIRQENRATVPSAVTHVNNNPPVQPAHVQAATHNSNSRVHEGKQVKPKTVAKAAGHHAEKNRPVSAGKPVHHATTAPKSTHASASPAAAGNRYTLQLSSSSRSDSLKTFAQQQGLTHFQVHETKREGKPWYILTSGSYASSTEAKNAISKLPAGIQEKKPWARPLSQVKQDIKK